MTRRVTIKDIARLARVGVGTVSRVLNQDPNVADPTRDRVLAVIERTGYQPSFAARSLRTEKSRSIGFVADAVATTPYAVNLIRGAQAAAWQHGHILQVIDTDHNPEVRAQALAALRERRVEGVLYAAMFHQRVELPDEFLQLRTVLVDCFDPDGRFPSVVPDEIGAGRAATERLLAAGHRRVALIPNDRLDTGYPAVVGRFQGYREALERHGLAFDPALLCGADDGDGAGRTDAERGYRCTLELLALPQPPSAVFCGSDRIAMGVYAALLERGLRIPDDVAVIGFDNQEVIAGQLRPGLTTMQLPHEAMGRWAVERIFAAAGALQPVQRLEPCPLVERGSV